MYFFFKSNFRKTKRGAPLCTPPSKSVQQGRYEGNGTEWTVDPGPEGNLQRGHSLGAEGIAHGNGRAYWSDRSNSWAGGGE